MEYGFIIGGIILAFVGSMLFQGFKKKKAAQQLLQREHLLEVATSLQSIEYGNYDPNDPPLIQTELGLLITYAQRSMDDNIYLHLFSICSKDIPWDNNVQRSLVSFICNLFDISPPQTARLSEQGILHFTISFRSTESHENFLQNTIEIPEFPRAFLRSDKTIAIENIRTTTAKNNEQEAELA